MNPDIRSLRKIGWKSLKGQWSSALLLTIVAAIIGTYSFGPRLELLVDIRDPAWFSDPNFDPSFHNLFAFSIVTIRSALVFLLGGAARLGHNLYYADLQRKRLAPGLKTLFCRYPEIVKAMQLRVLI